MDVTPQAEEGHHYLHLKGRFDGNGAGVVQKAIDALSFQPGEHLVLDLAGVPYLSSAGLRVLLLTRHRCEIEKASFSLTGIQPYCLEVLRVGGLEHSFQLE